LLRAVLNEHDEMFSSPNEPESMEEALGQLRLILREWSQHEDTKLLSQSLGLTGKPARAPKKRAKARRDIMIYQQLLTAAVEGEDVHTFGLAARVLSARGIEVDEKAIQRVWKSWSGIDARVLQNIDPSEKSSADALRRRLPKHAGDNK